MIDWMLSSSLTSLTHLDGRNAHKLVSLRPIFSEYAWMKLRLSVMARYAKEISTKLSPKLLTSADEKKLESIIDSFSLKDADKVVTFEKTVNHDLKALELFLADSFARHRLSKLATYLNLGIGSEDINSIALGIQLKKSKEEVIIPNLTKLAQSFVALAKNEKDTLMIARTHAQPANVTTFGKEVANSLSRLCDEVEIFTAVSLQAKCSGEAGTFQAFGVIRKDIDWVRFTDTFIRSYGLVPAHASTQIAPYESLIRYLQTLYRINSILLDVAKNMWLYVLFGYLRVRKVEREVGSSGMPHKVNPMYFEGAEGGLEMANGVIETLVRKLPINRMQRDFSDSTLRRNIVLVMAYSLLSYQSIEEALRRIDVDRNAISRDAQQHAEIWIETIKTYGTTHGISNMYDRLKGETRGRTLPAKELQGLIGALPLTVKEKQELTSLCDGKHNPYPGRIVGSVIKKAKKVFNL